MTKYISKMNQSLQYSLEKHGAKVGYFVAGHLCNFINKLTGIRARIDRDCRGAGVDVSELEKKTEFLKRSVGNLHLRDMDIRTHLSSMVAYELKYYRQVVLRDDNYKSYDI